VLTVTTAGFEAALARVKNAPKQIRFALTKTINEAATSAQSGTVGTLLPSKFTLRAKGQPWQKPGGAMGFNIRPFAKANQAEPFAVMGSRANWLARQEEGGTKQSTNGKALALPIAGTARPTPTAIIARRNKPARLMARKGFFVLKTKRGGHAIFQRTGRKGKKTNRVWFAFGRSAHIKPVLGFGPFASSIANRVVAQAFTKHLRAALATAH